MTSRLAYFFKLSSALFLSACASSSGSHQAADQRQGGFIEPPPGSPSLKKSDQATLEAMLGQGGTDEVSSTYTGPGSESDSTSRLKDAQARRTDEEIVGSSHSMEDRSPSELGALDKDLQVMPVTPSEKIPSYTVELQKIKAIFQTRQYESALIECNNLLRYYPNAAQIYLMKGTLHSRLGQLDLALRSYERAFQLEPSKKLRAQMDHIQRLIAEREALRRPIEGLVVPGGAEITSGGDK